MNMLNFSTSTIDFQALLDSSRGPVQTYLELPAPRHFRALGYEARYEDPRSMDVFREIETDAQGRLAVPCMKRQMGFRSRTESRVRYPRTLDLHPELAHPSLLPPASKSVFAGSEPCAFVCEDAREGDLLVPWSKNRMDSLLVLRRAQCDMYSIVGQALSINEHFLYGGGYFGWDMSMTERRRCYHAAHFEFNLTPEERMLLGGQDYLDGDRLDPHAQLDRLRTRVALYADAAVRVTDKQWFTEHCSRKGVHRYSGGL